TYMAMPGRENVKPANDRKREAVALSDNNNFWQTIVLSRFDLEDMTQSIRYILRDWGDCFTTITDDMDAFLDHVTGDFIKPELEKTLEELTNQIEQHKTVFELCKTALHLPMYFENHGDLIVDERHPTKISETINKGRWITKKKLIGPKEKIMYRRISVLRDIIQKHPTNTYYKAPPINIETSGYWQKLPVNQVGGDKHGNPIHGRTWIKKVLTWLQTDRDPGVIRATRNKGDDENDIKSNKGYIYVMRSAAHEKDIFKIGLTRKSTEVRSDELSRTTGSPDKFLVVQEWEVSDCIKAEKIIHEKLSQYRINPDREFFKAPYKAIVRVIDSVIEQTESKKPKEL
ncbi:MAG: GIY-YIG nuclease family protein, partial [Deltaproteobacteria bacterium]|nr:GIY-YIG nuclease family protein [Deltaproteobacteria bacterium]